MKRPLVILHAASSLDGKLDTYEKSSYRFGSKEDQEKIYQIRELVDAVIIGTQTLKSANYPILTKKNSYPLNVLISRSLDFDPSKLKFFQHMGTKKLVFTSSKAPFDKIKPYAEVVFKTEPEKILEELSKRGIKAALLESGGSLNAQFFERDLVDEIYLTLCPLVLGGQNAPTLFDGLGLKNERSVKYKLLSSEISQSGELFLHYKKTYSSP
jgi:5-amino-6-(5-phosphoribosylamino)uracil reductase